eukprot:Gb_11125 [translate_table: standard]
MQSLDGGYGPDRTSPIIFSVPKTLLNENEAAYVPQVVSLGPYHFRGTERLDEIEMLKSEVAIKTQSRMPPECDFMSLVRLVRKRELWIRDCYDKEITCSSKVLALMMARDVCFVLEVLTRFHQMQRSTENVNAYPRINRILNRNRYHPLLNDILKDMLKMENQLPLDLLREVLKHTRGIDDNRMYELYFKPAVENLSPLKGNQSLSKWQCDLSRKDHILQLLHDYIVGDYQETMEGGGKNLSGKAMNGGASKPRDSDHFFSELGWAGLLSCANILVCSPFFIPWFIWKRCQGHFSLPKSDGETADVPSVEELKNVGMKFRKCEGGIGKIRFEGSTLYLPHFQVDDRSEVMLRNLMALEISNLEQHKPITRYAVFMNELIDTAKDVSILKKYETMTNKLGSDEDAAKLWNSITNSTESPTFDPIDEAAKQVKNYYKRDWEILWARFRMIHCSEPWVAVSVVAATVLLLLTAIQVICLFCSCTIK